MLLRCSRTALVASPTQSQHFVAAPACYAPLPQDVGSTVPGPRGKCSCAAVRAADVGVSDEWAGLLDPGEGTTRSHGRSKRPALRAKVEHLRSIAVTLARLTTAQLAVVQHLLSDRIIDATLRARAINRTNQGRSREEKLISKLLMSEHTDAELAAIEAAVTAIITPGGSKQGTSQATALAESWCNRLLGKSAAVPSIDAEASSQASAETSSAATHSAAGVSEPDVVTQNALNAESEVVDAAIVAGEDLSHFRALLRKARSKAEAASDPVHMEVDAARLPSSPLGAARAAAELQVAAEALETTGSGLQDAVALPLPRRDPKYVSRRRAAKRARAALLKWLRGVAEAEVVRA